MKYKLKGFSLIEMAIVLVVMGVVLSIGSNFIRSQQVFIRSQKTDAHIEHIKRSICAFYAANNYLPEPDESKPSGLILQGKVPNIALGLGGIYQKDGYGNFINYSVDQRLTDPKIAKSGPEEKFCSFRNNQIDAKQPIAENDIVGFSLSTKGKSEFMTRNNISAYGEKPCHRQRDQRVMAY